MKIHQISHQQAEPQELLEALRQFKYSPQDVWETHVQTLGWIFLLNRERLSDYHYYTMFEFILDYIYIKFWVVNLTTLSSLFESISGNEGSKMGWHLEQNSVKFLFS